MANEGEMPTFDRENIEIAKSYLRDMQLVVPLTPQYTEKFIHIYLMLSFAESIVPFRS